MKTRLNVLTRLALLTALSLLLFTVESALPPPVPIPGVKLGLANVVTVWALYHCSVPQTALVLFARVLLASFFSGAASALMFSLAGGILCLCGSLAVHWKDVADTVYPDVSSRPDGVILSYPVITSGEFEHRDSFTALLGPDPSEEELAYMSLEKQVTSDTPTMFLWQTAADE
ncbi:MAG: Gx transporter family protein, partial [Pyramidobacter sp.]|nr:Gx transporter family protein [Pyramidobacter sp.]